MSLRCSIPIDVVDGIIFESNILENDNDQWDNSTAYAAGDRVMVTTPSIHLNYECVTAHTGRNPTAAANIGAFWVVIDSTRLYRPFDKALSPPLTVSTSISYRLTLPSAVDTIHMFGLSAGAVQVQVHSRAAARRNRLVFSESFSNAEHTFTGVTSPSQGVLDPTGSSQANVIIEAPVAGAHRVVLSAVPYVSGTQYTFSCHVAAGGVGSRNVALALPAAAFPGTPVIAINPSTGAIVSGPTNGTATVGPVLANGFRRVSLTATADSTTITTGGQILMLDGISESYTGNLSTLRIWGAQNEVGPLSAYQWVQDGNVYGDMIYNQRTDLISPFADSTKEVQLLDLPANANDVVSFSVYADSGLVTVGEIVLGKSYPISDGPLTTPSGFEIDDLSTYDENTFGFVNFIKRAVIKTFTYTTTVPRGDLARILDFVTSIRGQPVVWYDDEQEPSRGFVTYGRTLSSPVSVDNHVFVFFTIQVRGIT